MTPRPEDDDAPHQPRDSEGRFAITDPLLGHVIEWETDTGS